MRRVLAALGFLLICLLCSIGCTSGGNCSSGAHCDCSGGEQCFLECNDDRCDQSCHNTGNLCGTVCGDNCTLAVSRRRQYVLAVMRLGLRAGMFARANLRRAVRGQLPLELSRYGAVLRAGWPNSEVTCQSVGECQVQCTGSCIVHCSNTGCAITCADGTPATVCEPGRYACGGC